MLNLKRRAAFLAVPAVLALAAVSYGSVVAFSAASPSPTGTETESAEPAEAAEPGVVGFADADNVEAQTEQEGVN